MVKQSPPKLSSIIVAALQVASISGVFVISQPNIVILGPALELIFQGGLFVVTIGAQWVKYFWDKRRVASPETAVPVAASIIEAEQRGIKQDPEVLAAARRIVYSKMGDLAKR